MVKRTQASIGYKSDWATFVQIADWHEQNEECKADWRAVIENLLTEFNKKLETIN